MDKRYEHLHVSLEDSGFDIVEQHWLTSQDTPLEQQRKLPLTIVLDQAVDGEYSEYLNGLNNDQINAILSILATAEPSDIYREARNEVSFNIDPASKFIKHFDELDLALKITIMKVIAIGLRSKFQKMSTR